MAKNPLLAQIHVHFSIHGDSTETLEGEILVAEQVKAVERFIRWHERQVATGRLLLDKLQPKIT